MKELEPSPIYHTVVHQSFYGFGNRKTFLKYVPLPCPPQIGWYIQSLDWNEEGTEVTRVYINPIGVLFVELKTRIAKNANQRALMEDDYEDWTPEPSGDVWRMSINQIFEKERS